MSEDYRGHSDQMFGHISYSQHGEDLFILGLFYRLKISRGRYLDLGAHHPEHISNTAALYKHGWTGANVDASEKAIELFKKARPHDININAGIGPEQTVSTFYMFGENHGRNTFSEKESLSWGATPSKSKPLCVITLQDAINTAFKGEWPDFINMDIEGYDLPVLRSLTIPPEEITTAVWCIECRSNDEEEMKKEMLRLGYSCLCRAVSNLIFVKNNLIEKVR